MITIAEPEVKVASAADLARVVRLLGGLTSPRADLSTRAATELRRDLPALERAVISGQLKEYQLRELHRVGPDAVPSIVRMLKAVGPNCRDRSVYLIESLSELACQAPALMVAHQADLEEIIQGLKEEGDTCHADTPERLGECLGAVGPGPDEFLAEAIAEHARHLVESRVFLRDQVPLRLIALVRAAERCGGPKSSEAISALLENRVGAALAIPAMLRMGNTAVMSHLTSEVVAENAGSARLELLRQLLVLPLSEANHFVWDGKKQLKSLAMDREMHHNVRGAALDALFRFFFRETLELAVGLADDRDLDFLLHLVRAAFASDGIQMERNVTSGVGGGEGEPRAPVQAEVFYAGGGSGLGEEHVKIARKITASGSSEAASFLFALLGEGCQGNEDGMPNSAVFYHPVSLLHTPPPILDQLAEVARHFARSKGCDWHYWALRAVGRGPSVGAVHAIKFLLRIGDATRLARLAESSLPNVAGRALRLSGKLARKLEKVYASALIKGSHEALWGLIDAVRDVPEAASLIRSYGVGVLFWATAQTHASDDSDPFKALAQRAPALAFEIYQKLLLGEAAVDFHKVAGLHGSGQNAMEAFLRIQRSIEAALKSA